MSDSAPAPTLTTVEFKLRQDLECLHCFHLTWQTTLGGIDGPIFRALAVALEAVYGVQRVGVSRYEALIETAPHLQRQLGPMVADLDRAITADAGLQLAITSALRRQAQLDDLVVVTTVTPEPPLARQAALANLYLASPEYP